MDPFMPDELSSLTDHLRDFHIDGNTDVSLISECPSTTTRHLSALLNCNGSSVSDAAPVRTTNVFSSNAFQLKYLSAFDKGPFYYRLLHRNAPEADISDSGMENRPSKLKLRLMQRKKEPGPTLNLYSQNTQNTAEEPRRNKRGKICKFTYSCY